MISPTLTAEVAQLHQAEMRATARRLSLSRLFRHSPEPESRPAPSYGGITAVPALPQQRRAPEEHVHHHAA
jgi:hypothetical protein